ncbi:MAG TPA: potassium channel family protein [Acidimicrobiia bacterium]|nr:potassium channel family protein [Acidimicrobiia bacterium]
MSDRPNSDETAAPVHPEESDFVPLRERYGLILALILAAYVVTGVDQTPLVALLNSLIWAVVLLAALWSPGLPSTLRRVGLGATLILFVSAITLGWFDSETAEGWRALVLATAQLAALLAILSRVLRHRTVRLQTVMGGVAAYALLAFVMAAVYFGFDRLTASEFLSGITNQGDYTYFSFVVMTTVGFGDITPVSDLAKRLVVIEAFVGQVFIVTFVARLVSLWGQPLRVGRE